MPNYISSYLEEILLVLFFWLLIGIIRYEVFEKYLDQLLKGQRSFFAETSFTIANFANSLAQYFDATDVEISERINKNRNWDNIAENVTAIDINRADKPIIANRIKIEKVIGGILGFITFGAMLYGSILQIAETLTLLGLQQSLPTSLNIPIIYHMIIIVLGITISNSLYISDILNATSFTNASRRKDVSGKLFFISRIVSIISTIVFLLFLTIKDSLLPSIALGFLALPLFITLGISLDSFLVGLLIIISTTLYLINSMIYVTVSLTSFAILLIKTLIYFLWLLFERIVLSPIRFMSAVTNKKG